MTSLLRSSRFDLSKIYLLSSSFFLGVSFLIFGLGPKVDQTLLRVVPRSPSNVFYVQGDNQLDDNMAGKVGSNIYQTVYGGKC